MLKQYLVLAMAVACISQASAAGSGDDRFNRVYRGNVCEMISQELVLSIIESEKTGRGPQLTDSYQLLIKQRELQGVDLNRVFRAVKKMQGRTGVGYPELQAEGLRSCSAEGRAFPD